MSAIIEEETQQLPQWKIQNNEAAARDEKRVVDNLDRLFQKGNAENEWGGWCCLELIGSNRLFLDIGSDMSEGVNPFITERSSEPSQTWFLDMNSNKIQSRQNGLVLKIDGSMISTNDELEEDGIPVLSSSIEDNSNQEFYFEFIDEFDDDIVKIKTSNSLALVSSAMPNSFIRAVKPPQEDNEEEEEDDDDEKEENSEDEDERRLSVWGDMLYKWRIVRLANGGDAGPLSVAQLKKLGWANDE